MNKTTIILAISGGNCKMICKLAEGAAFRKSATMDDLKKISVSLLQPGVFIELPGKWFTHPFLLNKFKLKNWNQIEILEKSGIQDVLWVPEKSDCWPRQAEETVQPPQPAVSPQEEDPYVQLMWRIKREQIEHLRKIHENLRRCTQNYHRVMKNIPAMMDQMTSYSPEAVKAAEDTISGIVDVFLGDTNAIVHLINIKEREEGLYHHAMNVSVLAVMLGKKVKLSSAEMKQLGLGALLHDIGKSRIDKKVLRKTAPLNRAETAVLQLHPHYGMEILTKCGIKDEAVLRVVMEHHEFTNGQGYPAKLKGDAISKPARILRIVDSYDNLCNHPDPRKRMTPYEALSHIYAKQQTQIDLELFSVFIRSMGIYPPGTIVKLSNGEVGIIISINPDNPLKPSLLIYDPDVPRDEALICEMEEHEDIEIARSIRFEELPEPVRLYLSASTHVTYFMAEGISEKVF